MADFSLMGPRLQGPLDMLPFHQWIFPDGEVWTAFHRTATGYLLRFPDLADFAIAADDYRVQCHPAPGITEETLQHLYCNQILPLVLSSKGKLVLHGSAVEVGEIAVAFVATSGRGKSTLAASFARSGFPFLTDDGLVVEAGDHGFQVMPGHPSIRLWADSELQLIGPEGKAAAALPYTAKSRFLAGPEIPFCDRSRPLRRMYFLGDGSADAVTIHSIRAAEAMMECVQHSFLLDIEEQSRLASHFDQAARLSNQPMHYRLDYPRRFDILAEVRSAILEHISKHDGGL